MAEEKETSGDAPAGPFSMAAARGSVLSGNQPRPAGPVLDGPMPKAWQQNRSWPQTPGKVQSSGKGIALRLRPAVGKLQAQAQAYVQAREAEQMSQEKETDTGDSLYVKGLPAEATVDSVKDLFAHYGHVKSVRMLVQNAVLRGVLAESIALVILESAEDAEWIRQKLDGNIPFGLERAVSVQYVQPKGGIKKPLVKLSLAPTPTLTPSLIENNSTHVYLKGLPPDVDDNFIRRTFELFGTVEVARVLRNSAGHCAGIGFVRFSKHEVACEAAKKMLGLPMSDGTPLYTSLNPDSKFQAQRPQSSELQRQLLQMRQAELSKKDPNYQVPSYARPAQQQQQAQQAQLQQQQQQADAYAQLLQQQALAAGVPVDLAALAAQGQHPAMFPPQLGFPFQMPLVPGQPPQPQDLAMLQQQYLQQYLQQQYLQQYLQAQQQAQQAQQPGLEAMQPQAPEPQQQLEAPPGDPQLQYMQQQQLQQPGFEQQQQPGFEQQQQQPGFEQQQPPQQAEAQGYGVQAGYGYEAPQAYQGQGAEAGAPAAAPEAGDGGEPPHQCPSLVDALEEGKEVAAANAWGEAAGGDWAQSAGSAGAQAAAEAGWTTQGFKRPGEEVNAQEPPAKQARMPTRAMEWVERQEEFFPGAPPLPEGWVRAKARSSGKTYYLRLRDTHTTYNINEVWREAEQRRQKASE